MKIVWIGGDADWRIYNSGAANAEQLFIKYLLGRDEVEQIDFIDLPFPNPHTHRYPPEVKTIDGLRVHLPRYKIRYKTVFKHLKPYLNFKNKFLLWFLGGLLWIRFFFRNEIDLKKREGKKVGKITASPLYLAIVEPAYSQLHQQTKEYIQKLNPDILHVLMEIFTPIAALLKTENEVPNVVCAMEDWDHQLQQLTPGGIQYASIKRCFDLSKWSAEHADLFDRIFPVSKSIRDYMINIGFPSNRLQEILPAPVDLKVMKPVDQEKARKKLNLPLNRRILMTVGRFMERKKYEDLAAVLPSLPEDVILYVKLCTSSSDISQYQEEKIFKKKLKKSNVLDRVIIDNQHLKYEEMNLTYSAADVCAFPFVGEAFGMCATEAMGCEKPVILYNSGNFPSFICDNNGFLVNPSDLETLREKILYLLENPEIAKEMGERGRVIAKKYDIEVLGDKLFQIYLQLM